MAGFDDEDDAGAQLVKGLLIGNPGAGKTGALESLVAAGYALRIYDFDNLLGSLRSFVMKQCPEKASLVKYQTFTDKMKGVDIPLVMNGGAMKVMPFVSGTPSALPRALKQLNHWKTEKEDLGDPATWGRETFVIIDSLTAVGQSAFRYVNAMNPGAKDQQACYHAAQHLVMNMLYLLASKDFATNVLVLAHIDYDKDSQGNLVKGWPRSIGSALNTQIGGVFNCVLCAEQVGSKRQIRTNAHGMIDLKNPASHSLPDILPLETGLATFVKAVLT